VGRGLIEPWHILLLVVIVAVLFGWKKLPDISRSVGRSMRIFKSEVSEMKNDGKEARPSAAAKDTVSGDVVPPQQANPPRSRRPRPLHRSPLRVTSRLPARRPRKTPQTRWPSSSVTRTRRSERRVHLSPAAHWSGSEAWPSDDSASSVTQRDGCPSVTTCGSCATA